MLFICKYGFLRKYVVLQNLVASADLRKSSGSFKCTAAVRRCTIKQVYSKNSQNSKENFYTRFSFLITLQACSLQPYQKREFRHRHFLAKSAKVLGTPTL